MMYESDSEFGLVNRIIKKPPQKNSEAVIKSLSRYHSNWLLYNPLIPHTIIRASLVTSLVPVIPYSEKIISGMPSQVHS